MSFDCMLVTFVNISRRSDEICPTLIVGILLHGSRAYTGASCRSCTLFATAIATHNLDLHTLSLMRIASLAIHKHAKCNCRR
jgi:hypothetical protein